MKHVAWSGYAVVALLAMPLAADEPRGPAKLDQPGAGSSELAAAIARTNQAAERAERAALLLEELARSQKRAEAAPKKDEQDQHEDTRALVGGYLKPGVGLRYRPQALPKERFAYGFFGEATLDAHARPFKRWEAAVSVELSTKALQVVTDVAVFDLQGDGNLDGLQYATEAVPGVVLQEAEVSFAPHETVTIAAGVMRMPFTLAQQANQSDLMFASRAAPNEVFLSGADIGGKVTGKFFGGRLVPTIGVFNGDSLGSSIAETDARGLVLLARLDGNPLGGFEEGEGDYQRGTFRVGIGAGAMVRPATLYDSVTGSEPHKVLDVRVSASLRAAVRGFYFVAEYFRRQQSDDFSSRPELADGAYAQGGYFFRLVDRFGMEPVARGGFFARDQSFDARLTGFLDAGVNLLPASDAERPDDVKVQLSYKGERHFSEREEAHGAVASLLLRF
jgi:hypothetical protein